MLEVLQISFQVTAHQDTKVTAHNATIDTQKQRRYAHDYETKIPSTIAAGHRRNPARSRLCQSVRTTHAAHLSHAKKVVIIQLSGGNDGLNTVVPYRNDLYYQARPTLAIG